jgi:hypothetical protein
MYTSVVYRRDAVDTSHRAVQFTAFFKVAPMMSGNRHEEGQPGDILGLVINMDQPLHVGILTYYVMCEDVAAAAAI